MIDSLLLKLIEQESNSENIEAMTADGFEQPSFYDHWILPLRYVLAMRYIKHKKAVLGTFKTQGIYPVFRRDFIGAMQQRLQQKVWFRDGIMPSTLLSPLSKVIFYPLIIAGLLIGSWQAHTWYVNKNMHLALADRMPYYSELLHQALVAKQYAAQKPLEEILAKAELEKQHIVSLVPNKGGVRTEMERALSSMQDDTLSSAEVMIFFKRLNAEMDIQNLPYYMSPKLFTDECSSFAPGVDKEENAIINLLSRLLNEQKVDDSVPLCRTGIITVYKVQDRKALDYIEDNLEDEELPLYHVYRADRVPAADGALGLTFKSQGIGSLILLDQIKRFSEQSVLPALTFQGRSFIIPYWLQGYYDIEENITKNYKSDITELFSSPESLKLLRSAAKEMLLDQQHLASSRMQQTLQRSLPATSSEGALDVISGMMDTLREPKPQPAQKAAKAELEKLMTSLLPSIEYHEAYHQIEKGDWKEPSWVAEEFSSLSERGVESSLEELGAYLTQLVYTDSNHKVWLTKLLLFSINSMTQGQPEYYASSVIFSAMQDTYLLQDISPNHRLTVDEKVEIYKALSTYNISELQDMAKVVFEALFERPVVTLQ
ncbi:hypothetical protein [Leucothrix arctica]|uniref:Uncharacterized protein n=1 Tax=Leucothrix arctica TaxID=1481894 RepID=A0A317CAP5_9GAMM|nr:hypothetical protein [Leucothrix arctica]PWQ93152.1 hypothetical protein DKT75_20910 [Leucothrix arctica]